MNQVSVNFSSFLMELGSCGFNILRALNHLPLGIVVFELQLRLPTEGCLNHSETFLLEKLAWMVEKDYVIKEGGKYKPSEPMSAFLDSLIASWDQTVQLLREGKLASVLAETTVP